MQGLLGIGKTSPHVLPDFSLWGQAGLAAGKSKEIILLEENRLDRFSRICQQYMQKMSIKKENLMPTRAGYVLHYRGPLAAQKKLAYLRFENHAAAKPGGEHMSFTIDTQTNKIFGLTHMSAVFNGCNQPVSHQQALAVAIAFLQKQAPDLLGENTKLSDAYSLVSLDSGSRIEFPEPLKFGNLSVHWIDMHKERIIVDEQTVPVCGMKVKTSKVVDGQTLWNWVIVGDNGEVITFERDIHWNFDQFERETQMWLHDQWLIAQEMVLPVVDLHRENG